MLKCLRGVCVAVVEYTAELVLCRFCVELIDNRSYYDSGDDLPCRLSTSLVDNARKKAPTETRLRVNIFKAI